MAIVEVKRIVNSSVITRLAYEPGNVIITFHSGAEYAYPVPRKRAFTNFVKASSTGTYYNRVFKKHYGPGECIR